MNKKTPIEWLIIAIILGGIVSSIGFTAYAFYQIQEEGGLKQAIINAGKEVKDIARQINEDE